MSALCGIQLTGSGRRGRRTMMKKVVGLVVAVVAAVILAFGGTNSAQAQGYYYQRGPVCPAFYYWDPYVGYCVPARDHYRPRPPTTEERIIGGVMGIIEEMQERERRQRREDWCRRSGRC